MQANKILKSKLVMLLFLSILAGAGYSVFKEVSERYKIETEITDLKQQVLALENRNTELSELIGYFESPEYQEKEARRKLNLQKPGEHVVVIPQETNKTENVIPETKTDEPANVVKWWDFFFGF